ncbi:hypothetical protein BDQ17DRAFT_1432165 [Cyathus striatus]|nr:hypothetical protein BDQ17DRAFT_1432165 [Cyathus striatus]
MSALGTRLPTFSSPPFSPPRPTPPTPHLSTQDFALGVCDRLSKVIGCSRALHTDTLVLSPVDGPSTEKQRILRILGRLNAVDTRWHGEDCLVHQYPVRTSLAQQQLSRAASSQSFCISLPVGTSKSPISASTASNPPPSLPLKNHQHQARLRDMWLGLFDVCRV